MNDFTIFYSWQNDLEPKANKNFINNCINKALKQLKKEDIKIIPRLDKDTEGKSGSPNIVDSILNKIDGCNIMISDITLINSDFISKLAKKKLTPNPNVLIELGYGVSRLTWDRVICLNK